MNCTACKAESKKKTQENVPYIVYESEMARCERQMKRLWIALIVTVTLSLISQLAWIGYVNAGRHANAAVTESAVYVEYKTL